MTRGDLRTSSDDSRRSALHMLAQVARSECLRRRYQRAWAFRVLYANVCDFSQADECDRVLSAVWIDGGGEAG